MLLCTALMMESSSRLSSSASAALLGLSKDSWECDSLKLCISRALWGHGGGRSGGGWQGKEGDGGGAQGGAGGGGGGMRAGG